MAEIKWIKLSVNMFGNKKIELIENMPEADTIIVIWVKLLAMAGKSNMGGYIMLTENIPYTDDMLISAIKRPLPVIRMALSIFQKFGMLDISEQGAYYLPSWEEHQNVDGMDKVRAQTNKRVQKYREKQKLLEPGKKNSVPKSNVTRNATVTESNETDIELDIEQEKESCCLTPEAEINSKDEGIPSSRQGTVPATSETDTDSEQNEISSSDIDYRQAVADKYLRRRGKGLEITIADDQAIDELIKEGVPLQTTLDGIDQAFDNFKPKHKRDEIRSVSYCTTVIYSLHASRQTADQTAVTVESEQESDAVLQSDEQYNTDDLQKMLAELRAKQGG
ncbi:phage replisome organizer N-terminal domain-containing protein [Paenibacillus peoriae]|uniref:phage replisome organizer N-terminal domain-containing protein n=1 Tax=Paenibacillus peoriae TaxID=59893 RepID=UPI00096C1FAE|nr:phage replisome organizer N-terminal domain-containing protein [Paenibacillus peoriae]OMF46589.1 hypothetical protein BK135_12200 [Paenibacillus peoriae]